MSHLVLARKFRPQNFATVIGQEHIRRVLRNSLRRNRVAHAYLFAGPRGVGKTSLARIFSKSLNCQALQDGEPCLKCPNCVEIAQGVSLAVREIDGASHNSVENVRELIENFRSMPPTGSVYKVYIIDEVHMLSTSAFNALLKSLEEPPPNTVFILATTEVHKIPETVISRCQRHDFRAIDIVTIEESLDQIITAEGRKAETGVTRLIARYSDGSMRDSQSLLERIMAYSDDDGQEVKVEAARQILGVAGPAQLEEIWAAIRGENASLALELLSEVFRSGVDTTRFLKEFVEAIRVEFCSAIHDKKSPAALISELEQLLSMATRGADSALRSVFSDIALESLVVRLSLRKIRDRSHPATSTTVVAMPLVNTTTSAAPASKQIISKQAVDIESSKQALRPQEIVSQKIELKVVTDKSSASPLEWNSFLMASTIVNQRILIEHLKRLAIVKFAMGELVAVGPDFSIDYLQRPENLIKLQQELSTFGATQSAETKEAWKISLSKQAGKADSVYEREQIATKEKAAQRHQSALEHPSVKSLQRAFPGSNVSKVVVRK
jgi:DNA polymerase III subunit gamma/tau